MSDRQSEDVEEHRATADAVAEGRGEDAESLMARHVRGALRHREPERRGSGGLAPADRRSVRPGEAGTSAPGVGGLVPRTMHRLRGVLPA